MLTPKLNCNEHVLQMLHTIYSSHKETSPQCMHLHFKSIETMYFYYICIKPVFFAVILQTQIRKTIVTIHSHLCTTSRRSDIAYVTLTGHDVRNLICMSSTILYALAHCLMILHYLWHSTCIVITKVKNKSKSVCFST